MIRPLEYLAGWLADLDDWLADWLDGTIDYLHKRPELFCWLVLCVFVLVRDWVHVAQAFFLVVLAAWYRLCERRWVRRRLESRNRSNESCRECEHAESCCLLFPERPGQDCYCRRLYPDEDGHAWLSWRHLNTGHPRRKLRQTKESPPR